MSLSFVIRVRGPVAMFTCPHLRADPHSEPIITPSAAKGIFKSLYWKPEGEWEISRIHLLAPIRYETSKEHARVNWTTQQHTLRTVTTLVDVDYAIEARWVRNPHRTSAVEFRKKYGPEISKRFSRGDVFRQPHFGNTDHPVMWEYITRAQIPAAVPLTEDLGNLLLDMIPINPSKDRWDPVFFRARIVDGILEVPESAYAKHRGHVMRMRHDAFPSRRAS